MIKTNAVVRLPALRVALGIAALFLFVEPSLLVIDSEVLSWYRSQGADYENRMSAALKIYAEAHQSSDS